MLASVAAGEQLLLAYRDLLGAEADLAEALAQRGVRVGASVADQWPVLHDFLHLYGRDLSPAGVLVLAGAPDEGSRWTGIPFTGPSEARTRLGLETPRGSSSPAGGRFWACLSRAQASCKGAPLEALFSTLHFAHARPFDLPPDEPEVGAASHRHVGRLLDAIRPQAVVTVGPEALSTLGQALPSPDLVHLAQAPEESWCSRWPPGTPMAAWPRAEVNGRFPFRIRILPLPALSSRAAEASLRALEGLMVHVWG